MTEYIVIYKIDNGEITNVFKKTQGYSTYKANRPFDMKEYSGDSPPSVGEFTIVDPKKQRELAYKKESDSLYMDYVATKESGASQKDINNAKQAWLDKRSEIKNRYPSS